MRTDENLTGNTKHHTDKEREERSQTHLPEDHVNMQLMRKERKLGDSSKKDTEKEERLPPNQHLELG